MKALYNVARAAGIAVTWRDIGGRVHNVSARSLHAILSALGYPADTDARMRRSMERLQRQWAEVPLQVVREGKRFQVASPTMHLIAEDGAPYTLAVTNGQASAKLPPGYYRIQGSNRRLAVTPRRAFQIERPAWGLAVQLYALRGSPGIGDFGALSRLCQDAGRAGADAIMVSPIHALPVAGVSPYMPTSRQFINPLYIPAPGSDDGKRIIDWREVTRSRMSMLQRDWREFKNSHDHTAFESFVRRGGNQLRQHCRFMADKAQDLEFQLYLQWRADQSLATAQRRARAAGMRIGLITDIAVGLDPNGSEASANSREVLQALSIGAPPDTFSQTGQNWGLTAFAPAGLVASGYEGFIRTLRSAMVNAGGIRLDHAMCLMRLWVIPSGRPASEGAYLHYPFDALLGLLCLESQRNQAVVIGEDMGTVPPQFRRRIIQAGLMGMDVLWFSRDTRGGFRSPSCWPSHNAALTTTHDLPTLRGWWEARDLQWQERIDGSKHPARRARREAEKRSLWKTLANSNRIPRDHSLFNDKVFSCLAKAPSKLKLAALDDLASEIEQPNIPGTIDEHPNWRRRLKASRPLATKAGKRRVALLNGQSA
jgi:4-alpha-glucanotransferase